MNVRGKLIVVAVILVLTVGLIMTCNRGYELYQAQKAKEQQSQWKR